jgi:hypothetical protein
MNTPDLSLADLSSYFPDDFTPEQKAKAQTLFLKELPAAAPCSQARKVSPRL